MMILVSSLVLIFPLFFLPILPDPVLGAKGFFLAAATFLIFFLSGVRLLKKQKLSYSLAPLDLLIFLFVLSSLISWFFLSPGARVRSLIQPMGLGTMISLALFYFAAVQLKAGKKEATLLMALTLAGAVASLISIALFLLPESFFPWKFIANSGWSPVGSSFILLQFLIPLTVMILVAIASEFSREKELKRWWLLILAVLILVGLTINVYQTVSKKPVVLDWFSSWAIAVESFKRQPLAGVGPGNFNVAFNLYRPLEFNRSDNWALRFAAPHSWFLQVWTELGIIGLALLVLIFFHSWRLVKGKDPELIWFLVASWLVLILFPGNPITLFILFLALALVRGRGREKSFSLIIGEKGRDVGSPVVGGLLLVFALVGSYFVYRGLRAEILFYRSLQAAAQNRGGDTYNLQLASIQANRFLVRSRLAFAQTNFALANSLAQKGDQLSDEERQQIARLMNQAVNEAKAAVALEPKNVVGWENLAQTYRQLINAVSGADQWAVITYQQAIALDSLNPRLRVDYGGLLYALGQYEEAAKQFEIAVNLKSDYANAWYNWAWALKQQDKLEDAIQRLQQAVNLVEPNTPDYEKASQELEQWKKELGKEIEEKKPAEEQQPQQLSQPQPLPSPKLEEPIKLPEEAAPPLESTPSGE